MTVVAGNTMLASEYNTLRSEINRWFADNYAGGISFGNSNQTYGWGGTEVPSISAGDLMQASQMNALIDRCNIGQDVVNSVSGTLSQIIPGNNPTAAEFNAIESKSDAITTYRLDIEAAEMSVGGGGNAARSTVWNAAINATYRYTFANFDEARYFFNSGGALTFYGTISGYSTGTGWDGAGFSEIFTNMGTVTMNYLATTYTGSGGTPTSIGYYDLTTSYQRLHTQTGSGAYSNAYLYLDARRSTSGNYIELRVTLTPEVGRSVNGTTTCYTQKRQLNNQSSGAVSLAINAPSYSLIDGF